MLYFSRFSYAVVKVLLNQTEILSNNREPSVLSAKSYYSRDDRKLGSFR